MRNRSGIWVWLILAVCAALIVGAMAWLTKEVVVAERERSLADARADLQERIRLSLWRMDTAAAALMIEENQRTAMNEELLPPNPLVKLRFKVVPDGSVTIDSGDSDLEEQLQALLATSKEFGNRFEMMSSVARKSGSQWLANGVSFDAATIQEDAESRQSQAYQVEANLKERSVRGLAFNKTVSNSGLGQQVATLTAPRLTAAGMFQPAWIGGEAFLLRKLNHEGQGTAMMEGAWLNSSDFRNLLLGEIDDLLPDAALQAIEPGVADALALASFPWKLEPGEEAVASIALRGPLVTSLSIGWIAAIAALLAGAALVHGVMKLSERRASFVSAVTHELRTPLTTFRLYSEMLESGVVRDESKRSAYFKTLRREADRLSHLVENVLAFSRIERGSARSKVSDHLVEDLIESTRERFEERLAAAGMLLRTECPPGLSVRGDAAAIEQVIFNLVDNAAKYANSSRSNEVRLEASAKGARVEIRVCDKGPGIPKADRGRVFRAFHKSARAAAESGPGVGLGLALSRRLARQMGGGLDYRGGQDGACFVLSLPKGSRPGDSAGGDAEAHGAGISGR